MGGLAGRLTVGADGREALLIGHDKEDVGLFAHIFQKSFIRIDQHKRLRSKITQ